MKLNNFWTRILSGIALIIFTFYLFYSGPFGLAFFATLISLFGLQEYFVLQKSQNKGFNRLVIIQSLTLVSTMPLYPISWRSNTGNILNFYIEFAIIGIASIIGTYVYLAFKKPELSKLYMVAHIYITAPLIMLQILAQPTISGIYQPLIPVLLMVLVWSSDSWAYVSGKLFGKHKLAPSISPGKTWEGLIGGSLLTAVTGFLISYYVFTEWASPEIPQEKLGQTFQQIMKPWGWIYTPILGMLVGVFGTMGDLFESSMKRKAGVKDSGNIIPGHGGVLDRYDAFLFAIVVMYVLNKIHEPVIEFLVNTFGYY